MALRALLSVSFLVVAAGIFAYMCGIDSFDKAVSKSLGLLEELGIVQNEESKPVAKAAVDVILKKVELSKYDGSEGSPGLYLAILGRVYDVSRGKRHYGPGGGYNFFAGKDGTRAFVTGDFNQKGLVEDLSGLELTSYISIDEWEKFYNKDYQYIGKLEGHFYDSSGQPTAALHDYWAKLAEAMEEKQEQSDDYTRYPPCNSQWSAANGGFIWCSSKSGGSERGWVGVPRRYYKPGQTSYRCACVRDKGAPGNALDTTEHNDRGDLDNPMFREYENCEADSTQCPMPERT